MSRALFLVLLFVPSLKNDPLQESISRGSEIYEDFCMVCHMAKGEGVPNTFPPLAGADYLLENRKESIRAVKYGREGVIEVNGEKYNGIMTPLYLSDDEVADVMNYILNSWGNVDTAMVTVEEVEGIKRE